MPPADTGPERSSSFSPDRPARVNTLPIRPASENAPPAALSEWTGRPAV